MADVDHMTPEQLEAIKKKRAFKKFSYRGVDLEKLLDLSHKEVVELLPSRMRRRFSRGLTRKHTTLLKKLRKAKKETKALDKPEAVKTHLRDMPILPEMVGSVVGVYNGKVYNVVEVRPEMIGKYLAEFSITYKPTLHGRPGLGATHSSRFIPLNPFLAEGVAYNCCEQYMMAEKARLFGDAETLAQILESDSPEHIKRLGRTVKGYVDERWEAECFDVVMRGNRYKFAPGPGDNELHDKLLATTDVYLAEVSPFDDMWGVGAFDPDPRAWKPHARNLLGVALMKVRHELGGPKVPPHPAAWQRDDKSS